MTAKERVIEFIRTHRSCQTADVIRELGITPKEAVDVIAELKQEGVLVIRDAIHYKAGWECPCLVYREPA